jgi:hypothetical protein
VVMPLLAISVAFPCSSWNEKKKMWETLETERRLLVFFFGPGKSATSLE